MTESNGFLPWTVVAEPTGQNPASYDKEEGQEDVSGTGIIVFLTNGERKVETERVAFNRRSSTQPKKKFETVLKQVLKEATTAATTINNLHAESQRLIAEAKGKTDEADALLSKEPSRSLL